MFRSEKQRPLARDEGLLTQQIDNETVVYDAEHKEAHSLNPLAAVVFANCDGETTVDQLAALATEALGEPVDAARVKDALAQLRASDLMEPRESVFGVSRREMIRKSAVAGATVAAVPLITTIAVPTPAAAQTRTCGEILCCPCDTGTTGQPCCEHASASGCNCTAKESGASCKQCKVGGTSASTDVVCLQLFPGDGMPDANPARGVCTCEQLRAQCTPV